MATQELFCENCGAANASGAHFCQHCASPLPFKHTTGTLPEQKLLSSRYQLESLIGQGGMGAVYKAVDTRFNNRSVAVKAMSRAGLSGSYIQEAEAAFEHESHLLADLMHPNLPRIYDHFTEDERSFLVMDFIEGQTLEDYLEKAGGNSIPLDQVLAWGEELCDVLSYLHNHQPPIIFRDLKPSNVMIGESGHIYLIDFGIARLFKPGQLHDTVALGSPGYAAPEQYGKTQSTPRSDIYSLGALLHQLLTGADPIDQPFFFRPASQLNPTVTPELETLIAQMLEMDATKRPASAQEVLKRLRQAAYGQLSGTVIQSSAKIAAMPDQTKPRANVLLQEAHRLYTQRRLKEALVTYDRVLQTDKLNPQAWQGKGLALALAERHSDALTSFEEALKLDPALATSLNGKGAALSILRRNQEALEAFERALQIEPDNAIAWNGKGAVLSALNQPEQALNAFEVALHYDKNMAQALNNKGLVLRQLKRYSEALQAFEQAIALDANTVAYWNSKGLALQEMSRFNDALQAYQEAVNRNAKYVPAWYGIGNVRYAQRRLKAALEAFERAVQIDPKFMKAWDRRGNVLGDMGQPTRALVSYEEAIRIDPRYAPAWYGKASVLSQMERYEQAVDAFNRALLINSAAPLAWNGKGNAYYHLNNYEMALDAYERALRLNPRLVSALHNKSLVLKQLRRYEEALAAAEEAIRLSPTDPDNWQRKAEALRKLHRGRDARAAEAEMARLRGER